jgi:cobaltochelatase CobT
VEDFEPLRERLEALTVPQEPTAVTLLVDNSGSMRGHGISFAVGTVGILSMYLDRLGIPNEILGFTTKAWKGGDVYEKWREDGRPHNPGRLCPLRHIVYKTFDEQLQDVRSNLALMLKEGLLKENVDGEALVWASERLRAHSAARRVLLVISDGAPQDNQTMQYNRMWDTANDKPTLTFDEQYLERHLKEVIQNIDDVGDIQLDAIGISHDVGKYYGVGDKVMKLEELAPTAIAKLETLLKG